MLQWIECHPGLASWVQAVGSLIGIAVAIYVPRTIARDAGQVAEEQRRLRERNLAILIQPSFMSIYGRIEELRTSTAQVLQGTHKTTLITNPQLLKIDMQSELRAHLLSSALYVTTETAYSLQQLVLEIDIYNMSDYSEHSLEQALEAKEQLDRCYEAGRALLGRLESAVARPAA